MRQSKIRPNKEEGEWTGGQVWDVGAMQLKVLLRLPPIGIPSIDQMRREDLLKICIAAYSLRAPPVCLCLSPLPGVSGHLTSYESSLASRVQGSTN